MPPKVVVEATGKVYLLAPSSIPSSLPLSFLLIKPSVPLETFSIVIHSSSPLALITLSACVTFAEVCV
nr:MAG TPA_asm: hypothetical protein [Caudoviricetes sp.]